MEHRERRLLAALLPDSGGVPLPVLRVHDLAATELLQRVVRRKVDQGVGERSLAAKHLADSGHSVLLVDKAEFPRSKTCAGLINQRTFEEFEYLAGNESELVECAIYGVMFYSSDMTKQAVHREDSASGYLAVRQKFDTCLVDLATSAGAELVLHGHDHRTRLGALVETVKERRRG